MMFIENIKKFFDIESILDIGCNYASLSDNISIYMGIDTDIEKIKQFRKENFDKKNKIFLYLDCVREFLPKADIVLIQNIMSSMGNREIWMLLEKIRQSGAKYFLTSKDLSESPFYLPKSEIILVDDKNNYMFLYILEQVEFFIEEYADNISLLRKNLVPILDRDLRKIYNKFLNYDNGEKMFFDNLVNDEILDWQKQYYDNNIKRIVDKGIFDEYINFLVLKYNQLPNSFDNFYNGYINKENFAWGSIIAKNYIDFFAKRLK